MRHEGDEFDLLLSWALGEFVPDKDPPRGVWEAIEIKLGLGGFSEEVRPLPWRSKARAWLREAISSVQAVLLSLRFRLEGVWAEEQFTPASGVNSVSAAPWPLYSYREATFHCWWSLIPILR